MALPQQWIDRIFERLTLTYGRDFLERWRGIDLDAVKADWAIVLGGMRDHPDMLAYALQHLPPDRPPTALQFRELARRCPPPTFQALRAPMADPEKVRAMLQRATQALTSRGSA